MVIERAIRDVREHYRPNGCPHEAPEEEQQKHPGRFTYDKGGGQRTLAMAAAGVVCLQEFAQYDDWRIPKNIEVIEQAVTDMSKREPKRSALRCLHHLLRRPGLVPGGRRTVEAVLSAASRPPDFQPDARRAIPENDGGWQRPCRSQVGGKPGMLYQTAVACFVLAIPNRYLPILQEGKIDSLRKQFEKKCQAFQPALAICRLEI